jgi:hypothetical protein
LFFISKAYFAGSGLWNIFGIAPRTVDLRSLVGVFASLTMHGDLAI